MQIESLHRYPIAGCRGESLATAEVQQAGMVLDRAFAIVPLQNGEDPARTYQTKKPLIARIQPHIDNSVLTLTVPHDSGFEPISVDFNAFAGKTLELVKASGKVGKFVQAAGADGDDISVWLSDFLGSPHSLFRADERNFAFHDGMHLASHSSLDELNGKLTDPVPMDRFRANIVVDGNKPFEENEWQHVVINGVRYVVTGLTERCGYTRTDQQTGKMNSQEPLATLLRDYKGDFGIMIELHSENEIVATLSVGDSVEVER